MVITTNEDPGYGLGTSTQGVVAELFSLNVILFYLAYLNIKLSMATRA